jgi:hypothetical protein
MPFKTPRTSDTISVKITLQVKFLNDILYKWDFPAMEV